MIPPPPPTAPAAPATPPTPPAEFHRLAWYRPRNKWWHVLLTALLSLIFLVVILLALVFTASLAARINPTIHRIVMQGLAASETVLFDLDNLPAFVFSMLSLIALIPATLLASRVVQGRGVGLLLSVAGRLRWARLGRSLALAAGLFIVSHALTLLVALAQQEPLTFSAQHRNLLPMIALIIVLVPLQSAAEEYVFRGLLMQTIGRWLRHPAFAILLPVPLFVMGHIYDLWGQIDVAVFAVIAGWLTWRTGGIESAIALHVVNNVSIFLLATVGLADANATQGDPMTSVINALTMTAYAALVVRSTGPQRAPAVATPVR